MQEEKSPASPAKKVDGEEKEPQEKGKYIPLDEADINLLRVYGMGPHADAIKKLEEENKEMIQSINKMVGKLQVIQESRSLIPGSLSRTNGISPGIPNSPKSTLSKSLDAPKSSTRVKKMPST